MPENYLQNLSPELLVSIFSYFTPKELCQKIAPVCQTWWILSKTPSLWVELKLLKPVYGSKKVYCDLLRRCSSLHTLHVWSTTQIQSLIECADKLPHLKTLTLCCSDNNNVISSIISTLVSKLPQIEMLCLAEGRIKNLNSVVCCIVNLKNLTSLTIDCLNVNDACLTMIAKNCKKLERLKIDHIFSNYVTDEGMKALATFRSDTLSDLTLYCYRFTDTTLLYLSKWTKLRSLELHCSDTFTDKGLEALSDLPCLVKLTLHQFRLVPASVWSKFFSNITLTNLKTLHLEDLKINDAGLKTVAKRANKALQHLTIIACSNVSDEGLKVAIDNCSSLHSLKLGCLDKLTGTCLINISTKLLNLKVVHLVDKEGFLRGVDGRGLIPEVVNEVAKHFYQTSDLRSFPFGVRRRLF